jgi:two-component system phosphate regulon response regulator PhoB
MKLRILAVDDDMHLRRSLQVLLEEDGFDVRAAGSEEEAFLELRKQTPDLVLLDVKLPGADGFAIFKKVRDNPDWKTLPVIFLTSKGEEPHRVSGLEMGADDYIVKPFSAAELTARIRNVLRRANPEGTVSRLEDGPLKIDLEGRTVFIEGEPVALRPKEFDLLALLVRKKGKMLSRALILQSVWDVNMDLDTRTMDTHVYRLRKKLGPAGNHIRSVSGLGYKWE